MTMYKYNFSEIEKLSIEIWNDIVIMNREALRLNEKIRLDALEAIAYLVYDLENFSEMFAEESDIPPYKLEYHVENLSKGVKRAYKRLNDAGYTKKDMPILFSGIEIVEKKLKPFVNKQSI